MKPSVLIIGRDRETDSLISVSRWKKRGLPNVHFASDRSEITEESLTNSDVIVFYGHGYDGEDWSLGGRNPGIFRWSDYEGSFRASLIVFATCHASESANNALSRMESGHVAFAPKEFDGTGDAAYLKEWQAVLDRFLPRIADGVEDRSEIAQAWVDDAVIVRREMYGVEYAVNLSMVVYPHLDPTPNVGARVN